jgi:uncharacterized membrane protein HdeD (DUF308 family)
MIVMRVGAAVFLIVMGALTALIGVGVLVNEPCRSAGECALDWSAGASFVAFGVWGVVSGIYRLRGLKSKGTRDDLERRPARL